MVCLTWTCLSMEFLFRHSQALTYWPKDFLLGDSWPWISWSKDFLFGDSWRWVGRSRDFLFGDCQPLLCSPTERRFKDCLLWSFSSDFHSCVSKSCLGGWQLHFLKVTEMYILGHSFSNIKFICLINSASSDLGGLGWAPNSKFLTNSWVIKLLFSHFESKGLN